MDREQLARLLHVDPGRSHPLLDTLGTDAGLGALTRIRSARPGLGLPGLGHEFWRATESHLLNDPVSKATNCVMPDLLGGSPVILDSWWPILKNWQTSFVSSEENPKYVPAWTLTEMGMIDGITVVRVPVLSTFAQNVYQDGSPLRLDRFFYHGTRSTLVPFICFSGLKPSPLSHGQTGIWVNTSATEALQWNNTPFDLVPSLALEVTAASDSSCSNRRVRAGSQTKAVVTTGSIRIQAIILRVPSQEIVRFQSGLRQAVFGTVAAQIGTRPQNDAEITEICNEMFHLAGYRYTYRSIPGFFSTEFAGNWSEVRPIVSCLSAQLASILAALELRNPIKKATKLLAHRWDDVPIRLQHWLLEEFPGIHDCFTKGSSSSPPSLECFTFWKVSVWDIPAPEPVAIEEPDEE